MEPLRDSQFILGYNIPVSFVFSIIMCVGGALLALGLLYYNRRKYGRCFGAAEGEAVLAALEALEARVETLELKYGAEVTEHPFTADLAGLQNLTVTGIWDADAARIAF